jgi:hypothetical protein
MMDNTAVLTKRYAEIDAKFQALSDFSETDLAKSRDLFDFKNGTPHVKSLDTWTCLNGLPLPVHLIDHFTKIVTKMKGLLPADTRFYNVLPQNLQWEVCIVKWPDETMPIQQLQQVKTLAAECLRKIPSFDIRYRGFLITPDGTVIVR